MQIFLITTTNFSLKILYFLLAWTRSGDDLLYECTITLCESLAGFEIWVEHLDGREILLESPRGNIVKDGDVMAMPGEEERALHSSQEGPEDGY